MIHYENLQLYLRLGLKLKIHRELSKVLTYEFYYDYIKNKYGSSLRLLFADTGG